MKILFIGDIYGRSGREALESHLPPLIDKLGPDIVIVNGENAAHGRGINEKICKQFYDYGTDVITTGNHIWGQREVIPYIQTTDRLLRPINYPAGTPGKGAVDYKLPTGQTITVINAMGRVFMDPLDDPFRAVDQELERKVLGRNTDAIFIDFHAEATSEKMAFGHYFDGRVSAVIGTHTHIPTADHHILEKGTAYMSDAGMSGDYNSVIGADKGAPVRKFVKGMPGEPLRPANGTGTLCGVFIETNDKTGLAKSIHPLRVGPRLSEVIPPIQ